MLWAIEVPELWESLAGFRILAFAAASVSLMSVNRASRQISRMMLRN